MRTPARIRRSSLIGAVAAAAMLPACGDDETASERPAVPPAVQAPADDRAAIADVVRIYFNALAAGDGERTCAQMTSSAQANAAALGRATGATTCAEAIAGAAGEVGVESRVELLHAQATGISINGDSARAKALEGKRRIWLQRNDGKWQIVTVEHTRR